MKKTLLGLLFLSHISLAQQEIPSNKGADPNSQVPTTPLDTSMVRGTKDNIDRVM